MSMLLRQKKTGGQPRQWRQKTLCFGALLAAAVCTLVACEVQEERRGFVLSEEHKLVLERGIGTLTKEEVSARIGAPSYVFSFDPQAWHYLGEIIHKRAVLYPTVVASTSYVLFFNHQGVLTSLEESAGPIPVVMDEEETVLPSDHGAEVLKQMFHKFGKFPKASMAGPLPAPQ